ncbi:MAG: hypothetical protein ACYSX0_14505 [Planctomycetota bacterium]
MAIPRAPKTNVYRFIAVLGLLFVVAGVVVPRQFQDRIAEAQRDLNGAVGQSVAVTQAWFEAFVDSERRGVPTPQEVDRLRNRSIAAQVERMGASERFNRTLSEYRDLTTATIVAGLAGVTIMLIGFLFWRRRLHLWQDAVLGLQKVAPEGPTTKDELFH